MPLGPFKGQKFHLYCPNCLSDNFERDGNKCLKSSLWIMERKEFSEKAYVCLDCGWFGILKNILFITKEEKLARKRTKLIDKMLS